MAEHPGFERSQTRSASTHGFPDDEDNNSFKFFPFLSTYNGVIYEECGFIDYKLVNSKSDQRWAEGLAEKVYGLQNKRVSDVEQWFTLISEGGYWKDQNKDDAAQFDIHYQNQRTNKIISEEILRVECADCESDDQKVTYYRIKTNPFDAYELLWTNWNTQFDAINGIHSAFEIYSSWQEAVEETGKKTLFAPFQNP